MEDHPTPEDLRAFAEGELPKGRARQVLSHVLRGCDTCRVEAADLLNLIRIRRGPLAPTPEHLDAYDAAFDRVFVALRAGRSEDGLPAATTGKLQALAGVPFGLQGPELVEALLARVWSLRHTQSTEMVRIARLAVLAASGLCPRTYGERRLTDLRCRAWAVLGNTYRITDALDRAEEALGRAAGLLTDGTGDSLLKARVYDFQASLDSVRGRFDLALLVLDGVFAIHRDRGDHQLAGRALLSMAVCASHAGKSREALHLAQESLHLLDPAADPNLLALALYNLLCFLVECRRPHEAREVLEAHRFHLAASGVPLLQLGWIEARIEAALGDADGAVRKLEAIQHDFEAANQRYKAANVSLDIAALCLRLGEWDRAYALVRDAAQVFEDLKAPNRTRAALTFLRNAFAESVANAQLVLRLSDLLRRAEREPLQRMEPLEEWFRA